MEGFADDAASLCAAVGWDRGHVMGTSFGGMVAQHLAIRHAGLAGITAPTLVCAGRYDGIAPLANSERIAAAIPGAELDVFEGGHIFMLQDPRSMTRIRDFLRA